jgi:hypothetical protein
MPRYFFDFANRSVSVEDQEGSELADVDEARREALGAPLGMARDGRLVDAGELSLTVRNETETLFPARLIMQIGP